MWGLRAVDETADRRPQARQVADVTATKDFDARFHPLLDDVLAEIDRREPAYLARFGLTLPPLAERAKFYRGLPLFASHPESALEDALSSGIEHFRRLGVNMRLDNGETDPVALVLCDAIVDAYAATLGLLDLSPAAAPDAGDPTEAFEEGRTAQGIRYFDDRTERPPLVLINALGMSITLWWRLMQDKDRPWRLIVPEIPGTELIGGGMRAVSDLQSDSSAVAAVLDHAGVDRADLVTWCSGSRIAIEFAALHPDRVRSLTLVCPTLYGAPGVTPLPCAFEDDLTRIFAMVGDEPDLAGMFSDAFRDLLGRVKLDDNSEKRAEALFGMPAREHRPVLIAPLVKPDYLLNYGRRVLRDQSHVIQHALGALKMPMLLVTGDHDNHVNNAFTAAVFKACGVRSHNVRINGAGHYIYDLQYPLLRTLLAAFFAGETPAPSARIEVKAAA